MQAIVAPDFAIDPADPHFARLPQPQELMARISQRRGRQSKRTEDGAPEQADGIQAGDVDVKLLVGRLKRKQAPPPEAKANKSSGVPGPAKVRKRVAC